MDRVTRLAAESDELWNGRRYDTVIVDEGQDFGENEWRIVERGAGCGGGERRDGHDGDEGRIGRKRPPRREIEVYSYVRCRSASESPEKRIGFSIDEV